MKYIQIPEDESDSDVEALINKDKPKGDERLAWAPLKPEEMEDMKTFREPEDFI